VKLWGQISIELNVDDYVEAAEHQRRLEALLVQVRAAYPDATLLMRERRERRPTPAVRPLPAELASAVGTDR
jgi:hypothetical protein